MIVGSLISGKAWAACDNCPSDQRIDEKSQAEILREADDIFRDISRLRHLPIKNPVQKAFKDRDFFRTYYQALLQERYPADKLAGTEKAYRLLSFLPEGGDLLQTYLDAFVKSVQGLYDPKTKTLYIADWIDSDQQEETLAHELTHALQDQAYDLQGFLDRGKNGSMDAQFARSSVMEGDAVATALNYALEDKNVNFTQLANIASYVNLSHLLEESGQKAFGRKVFFPESVNFPYIYGATLLQKYVKAYGWEAMQNLYEHPPANTHQVIHPELLFPQRQKSLRVKIEGLDQGALQGYSRVWQDSFGEYGLFLVLRQFLPEKEARESVKGWRGDLLQVYEDKEGRRPVLTGYVVFQDEASADDFFQAYRTLLGDKYGEGVFRRSDDTIHWVTLASGEREVYVERFGPRVVFIEGTASSQTAKLRSALWDVSRPGSPSKRN